MLQTQLYRLHQAQSSVDAAGLAMFKGPLHSSPRGFSKPSSLWTLELVAKVNHAQGITMQRVSRETNRQTIKHLDLSWKHAKD